MKNVTLKPLACLALGLALAGGANAQQTQATEIQMTPEHFAQLDRNKSGGISKEEYETFMRESFQKLDKDGNQQLSPAEAGEVLSTEQFEAVDVNNDGKITLDEFIAHVMRDFDRYDYNKDGKLQP